MIKGLEIQKISCCSRFYFKLILETKKDQPPKGNWS